MEKIDFVIPWVDGGDLEWRKEKNKYSPSPVADVNEIRYRDIELLKYWFRSVEKYAPWVNKVHFITWGHLPEWLNIECEKLNIVNHKDYIPEKYLPTFSSHPIGLNVHRIDGLAERFVYFNDDTLLNAPVKEEFFFKKGLPRDYAYLINYLYEGSDDLYSHVCTNCIVDTNLHFSYIKSFFKNPFKYVNYRYGFKNNLKNILKLENKVHFTGLDNHHLPAAYLKQTFIDGWNASSELLDRVSTNKFRGPYDVNQSVFRYRQLATGKFYPISKESMGKIFSVQNDTSKIISTIFDPSCKMVCINDSVYNTDFERTKAEILNAYERKLPDKSSFEK